MARGRDRSPIQTGEQMRIREVLGARRGLMMVVVGGTLITPTAASAATLSVDKPCYVDTVAGSVLKAAPMLVSGTGYHPGDSVSITSSDGSVNVQATADSSGDLALTTGAPTPVFSRPGAKVQMLSANDYNPAGTITATTPVQDTELAAATVPRHAPLAKRVTWYFSGFLPGRLIYGHYLRRHQVALARFGRSTGVCGLLRVRARFYPGAHQRYRHYGLQLDDSRHYSKHSRPRIITSLNTNLF
jgi:hypothetical protein